MKLKIKRDCLLKYFGIATYAVDSKDVNVSLSGVKFKVTKDEVTLESSNNTYDIIIILPLSDIEIFEEGEVLLPNKYYDVINNTSGEYLQLELIDNQIATIDDLGIINKPLLDVQDFPNIERDFEGNNIIIGSDILKDTILQTKFPISKDGRRELNGVNFVANSNKLVCASTNIVRLVKKTIPIKENVTFNKIINFSSLDVVKNILPTTNVDVTLSISNTKATFSFDNIIFNTKLIDALYPSIEKLFNYNYDKTLEIQAKDLLAHLSRANSINENHIDSGLVRLSLKRNEVIVSTSTKQDGSTIPNKIDSALYEGDDLIIYFNNKFLTETIKALNKDQVTLHLIDNKFAVKVVSREDDSCVFLVMPTKEIN